MVRIYLALEGQVEYLRKTNPWRTKEDVEREKEEERAARGSNQEEVAAQLMAWAKGLIAQDFKGKGVRRGG